ncbi:MAG: hypothetical protein EAZ40_08210 [Rhodobacterales bacterium]|nr:MAG: hypothetical protein EAZ40_08210 [Rhodobacterales bacterium]
MRLVLAAMVLCIGGSLAAQTVEKSPRPPENPKLVTASETVVPPVAAAPTPEAPLVEDEEPAASGMVRSIRPVQRPAALAERLAALKAASNAPGLDLSTGQAAAPNAAEVDLAAVAPPSRKERRKKAREAASMEGAVCGVPAIKGEVIAPIQSKVGGCGVEDPVRVTSISGVRLSQAATVDCSIATALNTWVSDVAQPAFDGKLAELQIAAHYICRSRNNVKGAKISEHGKGRAIDIAGFILTDGRLLTVSDNYNRTLRRIYKAACGIFKTTLGPGSDGYHEDHFHFDTSARSGGAYCR